MEFVVFYPIFSLLILEISVGATITNSTRTKDMSKAAGDMDHTAPDGSTCSHLPHLIQRLDQECWKEEYGSYVRKKDLQGPWDCYIDGHPKLRRYLKANNYPEGFGPQQKVPSGTDGSKPDDKKQPFQLFVVFGSGPEPGHVQGEAENDSEPDMTYWCPDVREAIPVLSKVLGQEVKATPGSGSDGTRFKYLYCSVGSKGDWEDPDCPFRIDPYISLKRIPTLFHWPTGRKLEEGDCKDAAKVKAFVEGSLKATGSAQGKGGAPK